MNSNNKKCEDCGEVKDHLQQCYYCGTLCCNFCIDVHDNIDDIYSCAGKHEEN